MVGGKATRGSLLLPQCRGPKLHAFKHQNAPITWGPRLDEDRSDDSGTEGFVFRVEIESRAYALKVFKFFDPYDTQFYWGPLLGDSFPLDKIILYTDPFYAECRAFGRIHQARDKGEIHGNRLLAVRCHGYMFLSKRDQMRLEKQGFDFQTDLLDDELRQALGGDDRIRAIVKDLETDDRGLDSRNIRKAFERVRFLNELGVYNQDVRAVNFKNCRLVDFGASWTEPHEILSSLSKDDAKDRKLVDKGMFDQMVAAEGIKTRFKALPDTEYCNTKLRSWDN